MAGQIIARGKNRWLVRIYLGRDSQGKRQYLNQTVHGTKKEAQAWLNRKLTERDTGVALKPAQGTVGEYLRSWLETAAAKRVRPKTFAGYQWLLEKYVIPAVVTRPLSKVTSLELQELFDSLAGSLSPRTLEYLRMIVRQGFRQAVKWRLLTFDPTDGVQIPRRVRPEMRALTAEEARRLLAAARETRYATLFELALTTGLRPSEYCALKWEDVDFQRGTITVRRSLDWQPGGGWRLDEPKTPHSRRVIKLPPWLVTALAAHKLRQDFEREAAGEKCQDHGFVFTTQNGSPVDRQHLGQRVLRRLLKQAGLPMIRLYDLRHTAATLALSAGVPVKVVSEMLGHANVALTLNVYAHVLPHMQEEAAQRMEALLGPRGEGGEADTAQRHTIGTQRPS